MQCAWTDIDCKAWQTGPLHSRPSTNRLENELPFCARAAKVLHNTLKATFILLSTLGTTATVLGKGYCDLSGIVTPMQGQLKALTAGLEALHTLTTLQNISSARYRQGAPKLAPGQLRLRAATQAPVAEHSRFVHQLVVVGNSQTRLLA